QQLPGKIALAGPALQRADGEREAVRAVVPVEGALLRIGLHVLPRERSRGAMDLLAGTADPELRLARLREVHALQDDRARVDRLLVAPLEELGGQARGKVPGARLAAAALRGGGAHRTLRSGGMSRSAMLLAWTKSS